MKMLKVLFSALIMASFCVPAFAADSVGRVVAYDKETKKVTIIEDKLGWSNPRRPEFTVLPAKEFILPEDPAAMAPKMGGRLRIDLEKKEIIIYNPVEKTIDTFAVEIISNTGNIDASSPLISENGKLKTFPIVEKEKCLVSIYSPRQKSVMTIKVPQKYIDLPTTVWDNGDDCKFTYSEPDKVITFLNISKSM